MCSARFAIHSNSRIVATFQIFDGNTDQNTIKENELEVPIYTRYFRLHPKTFHSHISMRLELHGCQTGGFLNEVYSLLKTRQI